ncbi:MAG TPA: hypothetical protein VGL74_02940 [Terriglobales bacterium]|jgi:hypothetical protein
MARGWESKSVEQQQEEASSNVVKGPRLTPEQIAEQQRRGGLELSRNRIAQQLEAATNPRHRQMLEAALKELEKQLEHPSSRVKSL